MARVPLISWLFAFLSESELARSVTVCGVFQLSVVKVSVLLDGLLTRMLVSSWGAVVPSAMVHGDVGGRLVGKLDRVTRRAAFWDGERGRGQDDVRVVILHGHLHVADGLFDVDGDLEELTVWLKVAVSSA